MNLYIFHNFWSGQKEHTSEFVLIKFTGSKNDSNNVLIKRVVIETTGVCDVTSETLCLWHDVTSFAIHTDQICDSQVYFSKTLW